MTRKRKGDEGAQREKVRGGSVSQKERQTARAYVSSAAAEGDLSRAMVLI